MRPIALALLTTALFATAATPSSAWPEWAADAESGEVALQRGDDDGLIALKRGGDDGLIALKRGSDDGLIALKRGGDDGLIALEPGAPGERVV